MVRYVQIKTPQDWSRYENIMLSECPPEDAEVIRRMYENSLVFYTFSDFTNDRLFWHFFHPKTAVFTDSVYLSKYTISGAGSPHDVRVVAIELDMSTSNFEQWDLWQTLPYLRLVRIYSPLYGQYIQDHPEMLANLSLDAQMSNPNHILHPKPYGLVCGPKAVWTAYYGLDQQKQFWDAVTEYQNLPLEHRNCIAQFVFTDDTYGDRLFPRAGYLPDYVAPKAYRPAPPEPVIPLGPEFATSFLSRVDFREHFLYHVSYNHSGEEYVPICPCCRKLVPEFLKHLASCKRAPYGIRLAASRYRDDVFPLPPDALQSEAGFRKYLLKNAHYTKQHGKLRGICPCCEHTLIGSETFFTHLITCQKATPDIRKAAQQFWEAIEQKRIQRESAQLKNI